MSNPSSDHEVATSEGSELLEYAGIPLEALPAGVQDVLRCRNTLGTSVESPDDESPEEATLVFQILSFNSQVTRLARGIVGIDADHFRDRDLFEDASEDLAQEYIRFMLLQAIQNLNPSDSKVSYLSPPSLIKKLWASHILETRSYASMCEHLIPGGCIIHHSQQRQPTGQDLADRINKTAAEYRNVFGSVPLTNSIWPWVDLPDLEPPSESDHPRQDNGQQDLPAQPENSSVWGNVTSEIYTPATPAPPDATASAKTQIFVKTIDGKTNAYMVNLEWMACHLKLLIAVRQGVPIDNQLLVHNKYAMKDHHSLQAQDITALSNVHLLYREKGC